MKVNKTQTYRTDNGLLKLKQGTLVLVEIKKAHCSPQKDGGETAPILLNCLWFSDGKIKLRSSGTPYGMALAGYTPYQAIIVSDDEQIAHGDKFLVNNTEIWSALDFEPMPHDKKIIAIHDNFSHEQLQSIVDGKLKHGDDVYLECEWKNNDFEIIKLDSDNHIIIDHTSIPFIEPIPLKAGDERVLINGKPFRTDFRVISEDQYQTLITRPTKEEVETLIRKALYDITEQVRHKNGINQWLETNLK